MAHHSFEFDPSFQQIQIHGLWRWRNGQRSSVWVREDVRVLQRESKLEERIYDGSLSLAIEVRDVRVGDVVEVAWTEAGDNPVFDGNFTETYDTRYLGRTSRAGFRLVWERPVPPSFRAHNGAPLPNETRQGAAREYAWRADDLEPLTLDRNLPGDVDPWPFVELSTWESWGQVARWADGLFKVEDPGPLLRAELARLRGLPDGEPRLREAVRFVQDDLRYVGVELGASSHRPHPPQWVLERRFGDCKDKALVLVTLLRAVGTSAEVALVNTTMNAGVEDRLPTPTAFNHAIARAQVDGKPVWLDATASLQRGRLSERAAPRYARALLVSRASTGFTSIALEPLSAITWDLEQRWSFPDRAGPAKLVVTTRASGEDADSVRFVLASKTREQVEKDFRDQRSRQLGGALVSDGPVEWKDDPDQNTVEVVERYRQENFIGVDSEHDFELLSISAMLERPDPGARSSPLRVTHPVNARERIVFEGPTS